MGTTFISAHNTIGPDNLVYSQCCVIVGTARDIGHNLPSDKQINLNLRIMSNKSTTNET